MSGSGFYTNRVRYVEMIDMFRDVGFSVEIVSVDRWSVLPVPKQNMSERFQRFSDDDLLVRGFEVILSRPGGELPL
jgi:hypothetical protein